MPSLTFPYTESILHPRRSGVRVPGHCTTEGLIQGTNRYCSLKPVHDAIVNWEVR